MRRILIIAMILLSLAACKNDRPGRDIIPPEEIVPLLVDMHLVHAVQTSPEYRTFYREADSVDIYGYIFEKHQVDRVRFDSSIAWYSRHPKLFTEVYDHVVMQLTRMSDSLYPREDL